MLIAFEGIDGAGKTTLSSAVAAHLRSAGTDVELFHKKTMPDGADPYVREHLAGLAHLLWAGADRQPIHLLGDEHWVRLMASYFAAVHETVVKPASAAGKVVVTDNWYYKFFSRMSINTGYPMESFTRVFDGVGEPDLVVYLDVSPATAAARKQEFTIGEQGGHVRSAEGASSGFVDYQTDVASFYEQLARERGWRWLTPGERSPEELAAIVVGMLEPVR